MFNLSAARCPVDEESRLWIENRLYWLTNEFGVGNLSENTVILPTDEFFPDVYQAHESDVYTLLEKVCDYMDVDVSAVKLKFYEDARESIRHGLPFYEGGDKSAAGYFQASRTKHIVGVNNAQLKDPLSLVATIAHELGHVRLLGDGHISSDESDHEPLTDLFTVYYGLGVFTANSSFRFTQFTNAFSHGWQTQRLGYLSEEMFGYALGLYAWLRKEQKANWTSHLSVNVKSFFKSSCKYIERNQNEISQELKQIVL